ncbi:serine hydrolase domain-containing protein [Thalassotalea psychrophila]|uniref:Serine hydrolase domain-containing protein n=1 Tax=Thalassotalea psychrophila TaxID=3065647 RepID=A0ABY9TUL5_9GAMM|nr:serine hydrolase domain-containing protein [Colwelliaceae bacterium SQ149]
MAFDYKSFKKQIKYIRACVLLFGLLIHNPPFVQASDIVEKDMVDKIVSYIELEMGRSEIPGLALAIVKGDTTIHVQGFGKADENGRRVTGDTSFILGSTSKSFTAMAILQLFDKGLIELDKPVQNYIPWFRVGDKDKSSEITLRHLLNQTSGFSTETGRKKFTDGDTSPEALEKGIRELKDVNLVTPVGSSFNYSNTNYDLLGLVVQTVSGMSYEKYIQKNIFDPLDMTHSYTDKESARNNGLATGYNYFIGKAFPTPDIPYPRRKKPAGYLISSAKDISHYMIAQLNSGRYLDNKLLSDASMQLYHTPEKQHYAMGWLSRQLNGKKLVMHKGLVANYRSEIIMIPEEGLGVVVLINGQDSVFDGTVRMLPENVYLLLTGGKIRESRAGTFDKVFYAITLILVLQLIGIPRTFLLIKRWKSGLPTLNRWSYFRFLVAPLVMSVLLSIAFLVVLPKANQMTVSDVLLFAPDISWAAIISGTLALAWGIIRTVLVGNVLFKKSTEEAEQ